MQKTILIIKREYLTRVRKKSFIIMTLIGPVLMAALWIIPIYIATISEGQKVVEVLDETGLFTDKFPTSGNIRFVPVFTELEQAKQNLMISKNDALLYIPRTDLNMPVTGILFATSQPGLDVKTLIRETLRRQIEGMKLKAKGLDPEVMTAIKTQVVINSIKLKKDGTEQKTAVEVSMALGLAGGIIIYFLIFMFGSQVMRGVIEEKTSRIVEVIVSSVRPFQLMMGKIVGVGLVGLTQFLLWIVFTGILIIGFQAFYSTELSQLQVQEYVGSQKVLPANDMARFELNEADEPGPVVQALDAVRSVDFPLILGAFLFFFLGGYLLYSAMFAAIGAAVETEADTQQFMLPVTVPLILSMVLSAFIMNNPSSPMAVWLSLIPLTSPVVMMIRIPFGVPPVQIALSMALLVAGFVFATWMAAKIYRTGILLYGKKPGWREMLRWLKYKG